MACKPGLCGELVGKGGGGLGLALSPRPAKLLASQANGCYLGAGGSIRRKLGGKGFRTKKKKFPCPLAVHLEGFAKVDLLRCY